IPQSLFLNAGANVGVDPPAPNFVAGTEQSYTISLYAPSETAQTVTMTLTGAAEIAAYFGVNTDTGVVPLNSDGTFTVTIPAGETSVSFSLANIGDLGSGATLQLSASLANPNAGSGYVSSNILSQSYIEPTD